MSESRIQRWREAVMGEISRGGHYLTIAARQAAGHENSLYKSRTGMSASLATYKYIIYTFIILSGESIHPTGEHRRGASNMARWQCQRPERQEEPLAILTTYNCVTTKSHHGDSVACNGASSMSTIVLVHASTRRWSLVPPLL